MKIQKIITRFLDETQYYKQQFQKKQIVIHHTVSNGSAPNVIDGWKVTQERIGVAFVIDRQGVMYQTFSSMYWAHHLGTHEPNNVKLNQQSVGIELCNWGPLTKKEDKFYNCLDQEIQYNDVEVYEIPFRGSCYYQRYTDAQLYSLKELLQYLCTAYFIPKTYKPEMWELCENALKGNPGIYTHVSFRKDKSDCHPQKELINIIQTLN